MNLMTFFYGNLSVRVVEYTDGCPWFSTTDVCKVLDISNARVALSKISDSKKVNLLVPATVYVSSKQQRNETFIDYSALSTLVSTVNDPEAEEFLSWITNEVVYVLHGIGGYPENTQQVHQPRLPLDEVIRSLEVVHKNLKVDHYGKLKAFHQLFTSYGVDTSILPELPDDL